MRPSCSPGSELAINIPLPPHHHYRLLIACMPSGNLRPVVVVVVVVGVLGFESCESLSWELVSHCIIIQILHEIRWIPLVMRTISNTRKLLLASFCCPGNESHRDFHFLILLRPCLLPAFTLKNGCDIEGLWSRMGSVRDQNEVLCLVFCICFKICLLKVVLFGLGSGNETTQDGFYLSRP